MRKLGSVSLGTIALLGCLFVAPATGSDMRKHEAILIGQSVSLSGDTSGNAVRYSEGARLYFDMINRMGGLGGRPIRLLRLNDRGSPDVARDNTRQLIADKRVVALFGYSTADTAKAGLSIAQHAEIALFAPHTSSYALAPYAGSKMLFTVRANRHEEFNFLIARLTSVGLRRLAITHTDDKTGYRDIAMAAQLLHRAGGTLSTAVALNKHDATDDRIHSSAAEIVRNKPDAVVVASDAISGAALIRELQRRQYIGPFYGMSHLGAMLFKELLGDDGIGVALVQTIPSPWHARNALAAEYRRTADMHGEPISFAGLEGYFAAKVLYEGVRRAGPHLTRQSLIPALESINDGNYDAGGIRLNFSPTNHHGGVYMDMSAIARDGSFLN